ncbi:helix-turn-helix domain-containing protein [Enterococcus innesii]|uniref:helix-turn-helix domain-containing protein n=2 Tax=Enterococcus innesii TaxID=2839759 RepID=UPI0034A59391
MHAWEAIQKSIDYIEDNLAEPLEIEALAQVASLSVFYYQRLFTRLVKISVREYIKLRRLARAAHLLKDRKSRVIEVAFEVGFSSHAVFSRTFKTVYGLSPSLYQKAPIGLQNFDKPDLSLGYIVTEEGHPLISEGVVLEIQKKRNKQPMVFYGVIGYYPFKYGKMLGQRTGIDPIDEIWHDFYQKIANQPRTDHCLIGVSFPGDAPEGYSSYFVGQLSDGTQLSTLIEWTLPARDYIVCSFDTISEQLIINMGKAMRYTRFWLKKNGWIAEDFFPELYRKGNNRVTHVELWIPFKKRREMQGGTE